MGVVVRKKDGVWYVFVNHMGHRKAKRIGTDRKAAEQVKRVLEAKLALGDFGVLSGEQEYVPTFENYSKKWLDHYAQIECKPSTQRSYEQLLRLHVVPRFGKKKVTEITRDSVKQFASDLSRQKVVIHDDPASRRPKFSRNTLRLILSALRSVLNASVEDGLIQANPASKIGRFAKSEKPTHKASAMTRRELRQVLLNVRDERLLVAYAQGRASIADELVFPSQVGTPIKPDNIATRYMQPALTKAGLRKFRFHDLRHTFGSLLIQDGASLTYVKEQMGHSSIQITVDTYGHLVPGADISWVDRLDAGAATQENATPAQPEVAAGEGEYSQVFDSDWLPPRDSNPDMLIQSQSSSG